MLNTDSIHDMMSEISKKRPVFYSEHDFQATLAASIQSAYKDSTVIVEFPGAVLDRLRDISIDIVVCTKGHDLREYDYYLIELKYRFKKLNDSIKQNNPLFKLINQSDYQKNRRIFLENDLRRVEQLYGDRKCCGGCAIFLTNDNHYFQTINKIEKFSINPNKVGVVNIYHQEPAWISAGLNRDYLNMKWNDFGDAGFKYLLIDVEYHCLLQKPAFRIQKENIND